MTRLKKQCICPRGSVVPPWLDALVLFCLNVDDNIWLDVDVEDEDGITPPWMSDDGVCASIPALLELDRVAEEQERLDAEERAMKQWLHEEAKCLVEAQEHHRGLWSRR